MDATALSVHRGRDLQITAPLLLVTGVAALARSLQAAPASSGFQVLPRWAALVAVAAAGISLLASRRILRSRAVHAGLWTSSALLIATTADGIAFDVVGMVMKAVSAVTGDAMVVALTVHPAGVVVRLPAGISGVLLVSRALGYGRDIRGACGNCGRTPGAEPRQRSSTMAYAACVLALGYAAEKIYWGLGGTFGLERKDAFGDAHLWTPGLGDTALLALIGAGIALVLARPCQTRIPRWMPLTGAGLGSMMLVPVGIVGTVGAVASLSASSTSQNELGLEPWVFLIEYPWFLAWGLTLGIAARNYHHRTRPPCTVCGGGAP